MNVAHVFVPNLGCLMYVVLDLLWNSLFPHDPVFGSLA